MERRRLIDTEIYDLCETKDEENSVVAGTETVDLSELAKSELHKSGKSPPQRKRSTNKKRSIAGGSEKFRQKKNSQIAYESPTMGNDYIDVTDDAIYEHIN